MSGPVRLGSSITLALVMCGLAFTEASAATLRRSVLGSGATIATGSGRVLKGTVGQAVVGASSALALAATHGFWTFGSPTTTSVDDPDGVSAIEFGAPSPNPSHGDLAFTIGLPHAATVSLLISDVRGRAISPSAPHPLPAGRHRLVFNPATNTRIGSGIYFARLVVDGHVEGVRRFVRVQ